MKFSEQTIDLVAAVANGNSSFCMLVRFCFSSICYCHSARFTLASECQLENVVAKCSLNMTGADFYALCSDAMLRAVSRAVTRLSSGMMRR